MLDKLDALFLLLPELEVSIDRGCEDEIGPARGELSARASRGLSLESCFETLETFEKSIGRERTQR